MYTSGLISHGNPVLVSVPPATSIPSFLVETYRQGFACVGLQSPKPHKVVPNSLELGWLGWNQGLPDLKAMFLPLSHVQG